eukprot:COSAG05_NODE_412_length_10089_cov_13.887287_2_plen_175_part_00
MGSATKQLAEQKTDNPVFDIEDGGGADPNTATKAFEDEGDEREREWGEKAAGKALVDGDVDAFILWWCQNACASTWLDSVVLAAIILNTIMLAVENPANLLTRESLAIMVIIDLVLTVRQRTTIPVAIPAALTWGFNAGGVLVRNVCPDHSNGILGQGWHRRATQRFIRSVLPQ